MAQPGRSRPGTRSCLPRSSHTLTMLFTAQVAGETPGPVHGIACLLESDCDFQTLGLLREDLCPELCKSTRMLECPVTPDTRGINAGYTDQRTGLLQERKAGQRPSALYLFFLCWFLTRALAERSGLAWAHVAAEAGLELTAPSCLSLPGAGKTGVHRATWSVPESFYFPNIFVSFD